MNNTKLAMIKLTEFKFRDVRYIIEGPEDMECIIDYIEENMAVSPLQDTLEEFKKAYEINFDVKVCFKNDSKQIMEEKKVPVQIEIQELNKCVKLAERCKDVLFKISLTPKVF